MVGWPERDLLNRTAPMPFWPADAVAQCQAVHDAILAGENPYSGYALPYRRRNGVRFDVRLYSAPLIDDYGNHTGWMASLNDITELKIEREALKAAHERFLAVLNGLDAEVAVTNCQTGELLLSNQPYAEAFQLGSPDGPLCALPFHRMSDAGGGEVFDPISRRWYQVRRRQSTWVDGHRVWLDFASDITERKLAAERERQQAEKLQQSARLISMGEMASSLAHELNQPLAAISSYSTGCTNLLKGGNLPVDALAEALEKIGKQARRAGEIVRGIREFVQRREPRRTTCSLDELVDTVLPLLQAEFRKHGVKLIDRRTPMLPILHADRVMLEQVILNLTKNAIEAMADTPPGSREVTIETGRENGQLIITVADRGCGIEPDQLERLFLPFYTTKQEGMGMGLNICRSIVEYHHGRLWVEPNPGGGSRFRVSLPLNKEMAHAA